MPLQNRVTPFGRIVAAAARGLLMGNRGGRPRQDISGPRSCVTTTSVPIGTRS